ncbi:hypothetical protein L7G72_16490 [Xenorhabdus bovienii]|uniref:hypothetical protein n=1 Tax=Xenorhabdus bovienii TaxID=40576 RepID=UPI001EE053A8|nr:hypothetical protein [Xenorhabdus bovienii]MCG3463402.1 hypothetical protein [Xenorhabdus bovienii]
MKIILILKKQIEDLKYKKIEWELERKFKNNQEVIAFLSESEAMDYLKVLDPNFYN